MNALEIKNLSVSFLMYDKGIKKKALKVISDLSISIKPGEIHAVIGSSGSGKSLLAHALLGILPKNAITTGEMNWFGEKLTPALQKKLRGEQMVLVPQSVNYLDPLMRGGKQICKDKTLALETLKRYELDESAAKKYPFELSGGMARRVLVSTSTLPCAMPTRFPCSTPEPRLRRQRPRISVGRSFCAIPTARRCGARCRRINLNLFPELSPMPAISRAAASFPTAARCARRPAI